MWRNLSLVQQFLLDGSFLCCINVNNIARIKTGYIYFLFPDEPNIYVGCAAFKLFNFSDSSLNCNKNCMICNIAMFNIIAMNGYLLNISIQLQLLINSNIFKYLLLLILVINFNQKYDIYAPTNSIADPYYCYGRGI